LKESLVDFIKTLVGDAEINIMQGYYDNPPVVNRNSFSLKNAIKRANKAAVIAEIKFSSPSAGVIRKGGIPVEIAISMERGGATALSILTEPKHFNGSIKGFASVAKRINLPLIMKDIIVSKKQIDAAHKIGSDVVLLIFTIFQKGYSSESLKELISYSHSKGLEVILECHSEEEFDSAITSDADIVGINNRDLRSFVVDLVTTEKILGTKNISNKVIISESGIKSNNDIKRLKKFGVNAFLVGSSIMRSKDVESKVRELATSL